MKKMVYAQFEVGENESTEALRNMLNATGYNLKKFAVEIIPDKKNWEEEFEEVFYSLGITPQYKGYTCLYYMMQYVSLHPECKGNIVMKEIYAYVHSKTNDTYASVERNVRSVIYHIMEDYKFEYIKKILNLPDGLSENVKFTNAKFTNYLIRRLF